MSRFGKALSNDFVGVDSCPIVLLHSLGEIADTWSTFVAQLELEGRVGIAMDFRGHGASSRPGEYSFENMASDVNSVFGTLAINRCDVVGHSLGDHIALLLAGRQPNCFRNVVAEDPPPSPEEPVLDATIPTEPRQPPPFDWRVVEPLRRLIRTPDLRWWENLSLISATTLILGGGSTSHANQVRLKRVAEATSPTFAQLNVGHMIHTSAPDEFAALVLAALR